MEETLKRQIELGHSTKEISANLGLSVPKIRKLLNKFNLKTKWKGYLSQKHKFSDEKLREVAAQSDSINQFLSNLGVIQTGGSWYHYQKRLNGLGISFPENGEKWKSRGGLRTAEKRNQEALKSKRRVPRHTLKKAMDLAGIPYVCVNGHLPMWMDKPLILEIHHKDENKTNNEVSNLEYRCPNCHNICH